MSVDGAVPASVSALFGTCLYVSVALLVALSVGLSVSQLVVFVSSLFASSVCVECLRRVCLCRVCLCLWSLMAALWPLFGRLLSIASSLTGTSH